MAVPTQDPLTLLEEGIRNLMTAHSDLFVQMGHNLFRGFATILISWFGIQAAFSSAEGGEGFNFARFSELILLITFGFAMVTYYNTPIPGIGYSLTGLVMEEASSLSNSIGMDQAKQVENAVTNFQNGLEEPSSWSFKETLYYFALDVILATVQAVVFIIIGFGLIAEAVLVLVGPIFVPFLIVPKMDWLFWGWFKAFLQYSFYQVIAAAFVYIFAQLLLGFFNAFSGGMSTDQWITALPVIFIFLLIAIYGLLKIPTLTNHLFSGSSGANSDFAENFIYGKGK
jgi:hypothetical protein